MKESRWLRWVGPGLIALVAAGSAATIATGAPPRPWEAQACPETQPAEIGAEWATPTGFGDLALQPWYRLDPRLDKSGALEGQRLSFGLDRDRTGRFHDVPPESFAAGPFGRIVLVGSDNGTTSRLQALDVAGDCIHDLAESADVIRRATIDPSGTAIYEMRVDRASRADLGIWRRQLDGSTAAVQVLAPIPADIRFGTTFSTEFAWDVSGVRLAIQSCGEAACRTRIVDVVGGDVRTIDDADLGTMIGLAGSSLVTYQACPGLPCPILAVDFASRVRTTVAAAASGAVLASTPDGPRVVHEVFDGAGIGLRAVTLDGAHARDLGSVADGLRLLSPAGLAGAATVVPEGWVLLGPEGRVPANGPRERSQLRQIADGTAVQLQEIVP